MRRRNSLKRPFGKRSRKVPKPTFGKRLPSIFDMQINRSYFKNGNLKSKDTAFWVNLGPIAAICVLFTLAISSEARAMAFVITHKIMEYAESWVLRGLLE